MSECKHLNTTVSGGNTIGFGTCQDCGKQINLATVFDNWFKEFRRIRESMIDARDGWMKDWL